MSTVKDPAAHITRGIRAAAGRVALKTLAEMTWHAACGAAMLWADTQEGRLRAVRSWVLMWVVLALVKGVTRLLALYRAETWLTAFVNTTQKESDRE